MSQYRHNANDRLDSVFPTVLYVPRLPDRLCNLVELAQREAGPGQLAVVLLREPGQPNSLVIAAGAAFQTWLRFALVGQQDAPSDAQDGAPTDNAQGQVQPVVAGGQPGHADLELVERVWQALAVTLEMEISTMGSRTNSSMEPRWYLTVAELANAAGVLPEIGEAAERARLIQRQGRGFRRRLLPWLKKVAVLNAAGYSWPQISAWTKRRWTAGNEAERDWPVGFEP